MTPRPSVRALQVFYVVQFATFGVFLPFFPRWLEARGITGLAMGAILAVPPLVSLVAPPIIGAFADALRLRAQILRASAVVAGAAFGAVALVAAARPSLGGVATLLVGALVGLYALARVPLFGIADVLAIEAVDARDFGKLRLFGSLGFVLTAGVVGGAIDVGSPMELPLVISTLFGVVFLVALALPVRSNQAALPRVTIGAFGAVKRALPFFAAITLWQVGNSAYDTTYSLWVRALGWGDVQIGALWALGVVAEILLMAFASRLLARHSTDALLLAAFVVAAVRWALIGHVASLVGLALLQPLHAFSFALAWIAANARLPKLSEEMGLATAQGLLATSVALGGVLGAPLFAELFARHGGRVTFVCAAAATLAALVPATRMREG